MERCLKLPLNFCPFSLIVDSCIKCFARLVSRIGGVRKEDLQQLTVNVLMPHWYALCMLFSHAALRKSEEKEHLMPVRIHQ